ncbi:probable caffeoyl-CoA O-methyltransferase 1 [Crassostrea angulata]|uniref:probable caffeoyl-CoA O-methyltransferase 1 n=1 Tax=Magallana angulata TaxID=2784310 RepID=UPI0022B0D67E|nr:probable caffeoyl-CoA O-methyltransferase 1 [Crassostrea angulata]
MAERRDDRSYSFDPVYRHLLRAMDLCQNGDLPRDLKAEINRAIELCQQRWQYCEDQTTKPSPALDHLIKETFAYPWEDAHKEGRVSYYATPRMLTGNLEAQLIKLITSASKANMVLEIGLYTGCSSLTMAEALPKDGKVVSLEIDKGIADVARSFLNRSPVGNKIEIMIGPALNSLEILAEKQVKFDVIFIDADKTGYVQYYKTIFEKDLLASEGTIIVDNVLKDGDPYSGEEYESNSGAILEFNEMVLRDKNVHKVMIPVRDGVYLIRRMKD